MTLRRRAFTLVELLVVIAIIGLLSTVAAVSLSSARVKSRNTKRLSDVKQLVTALNLAYDNSGSYPASPPSNWACLSTVCTGWSGQFVGYAPLDSILIPAYLAAKPVFPADSSITGLGGYIYNSAWGGDGGAGMPAGIALIYILEGPQNCGLGRLYATNATYTECAVYFYN